MELSEMQKTSFCKKVDDDIQIAKNFDGLLKAISEERVLLE